IYFESRNQSTEGQMWVGYTILNRLKDSRWPSTIKDIVTDTRFSCQFSFYCDGTNLKPKNKKAWSKAVATARVVLENKDFDITNGSLFFKRVDTKSNYHDRLKILATIGDHVFYCDDIKVLKVASN